MRTPLTRGGTTGNPSNPFEGLPSSYTPTIAAYAPGPFLTEQVVTPSDVKWMNARTYIVRNAADRQEYRALRIHDQSNRFIGYWAIELLPPALDFGVSFEGDRQDSIEDYTREQEQKRRDSKRRRTGRTHD